MTTTGYINSTPLRWLSKKVNTDIRLSKTSNPGKYGSSLDYFKEGGLDITLDVLAQSRTERNDIVASFMTPGILRMGLGGLDAGWHFRGICADRSTDLQLSDYIPESDYPLSFMFITQDPFMYSDDIHCRGVNITASGQTWTEDNCYPFNKVSNWTFEDWGAGTSGVAPDTWNIGANTASISRSTEHKHGSYSVAIKQTGGLANPVGELNKYLVLEKDVEYRFLTWVKIANTAGGTVYFKLYENGSVVETVSRTANTDWLALTFTHTFTTIPVNPCVKVYVDDAVAATDFYVDSVLVTEEENYETSTIPQTLATTGTVFTVPDIQIEGIGFYTASGGGTGSVQTYDNDLESPPHTWTNNANDVWECEYTHVLDPAVGKAIILLEVWCQVYYSNGNHKSYGKITIQGVGYNGGVETVITPNPDAYFYNDEDNPKEIYKDGMHIQFSVNENVTIKFYSKNSTTVGSQTTLGYPYISWQETGVTFNAFPSNVEIFNTADPFTKLNICNTLFPGAVNRVNADGTGIYTYTDAYDNDLYKSISPSNSLVTYSSTNKEISIAEGGQITYSFDTKWPVVSLPRVILYIVSGTPKLSISVDNGNVRGTFYDCDSNGSTPITNANYAVDLNNAANCALAGATNFSLKIAPLSGALVVSSIFLYCDTATIDAERPVFNVGGTNTYQCDMTNDATCNISMIFNDRIWGI